ncbi:MAG: hypothetical protein LUD15_09975 [Bacteroides sp.]|nr:hypothetical protein [Bacteroides sp.]
MLEYIQELKDLLEEEEDLKKRFQEKTTHTLTDFTLIKKLYEWFNEIVEERDAESRRKFIFIVLYLYSPTALVGNKTRRGVREELTRVLDECTATRISHHCAEVALHYRCYKSFRTEMEQILKELLDKMTISGITLHGHAQYIYEEESDQPFIPSA